MKSMIEAIVGSEGAERVLLFLIARDEGYASEIASFYAMDVSTVQNQLKRMEREGLLVNKQTGRTRVYKFNPRYAFLAEVEALLAKALSLAPQKLREALTVVRRRPRRTGKPL
jgi:DNA-binding MarR family transcriptional regulator